jgi:hypothetical protein
MDSVRAGTVQELVQPEHRLRIEKTPPAQEFNGYACLPERLGQWAISAEDANQWLEGRSWQSRRQQHELPGCTAMIKSGDQVEDLHDPSVVAPSFDGRTAT